METHKKYGRTRSRAGQAVIIALGFLVISLFSLAPARAADSDLDLTFGASGTQFFNFGVGHNHKVHAVRYTPDGKIVACGETQLSNGAPEVFAIARFMANGSFDPSFNSTGVQKIDFGGGTAGNRCSNLIVQSDGKIIAVGAGSGLSFVIRMNTDGTQDSTFGTVSLSPLIGSSAKLQSDGKILVAGYISDDAAVKRLNSDGSTDTSFGVNGVARLVLNPEYNESYKDLLIQPDGKIILVGDTNNLRDYNWAWTYDALVIRLNSNGSMDSGFGTNGVVQTYVGRDGQGNSVGSDFAQSATLQPDGKILVAGYYQQYDSNLVNFVLDTFVIRYNVDGTLDTSFGTAGIMTTAMTNYDEKVNGIHLQSNGKILVTAAADTGPSGQNSSFYVGAVMRLNSDGSRESGFGTNGLATYPLVESLHHPILIESDLGTDGSIIFTATLSTANLTAGLNNVVARVMGLSTSSTTTIPSTSSTTTIPSGLTSPNTTATDAITTTTTTFSSSVRGQTLPSTGSFSLQMTFAGMVTAIMGALMRRRVKL